VPTSANPIDQRITFPAGADLYIRATSLDDSFVATGIPYAFVITDIDGNVEVTQPTVTVVFPGPNPPNPATLLWQLTRAMTLNLIWDKNYRWALWRTDAGNNRKIAGGPCVIVPTPEKGVV